ncbi:MAG: TolB family protein [Actinomycetota bacterium]
MTSPSPRFGFRFAPIVFLVLLAALAAPLVAFSGEPERVRWSPRPLPAASIDSIDPIAPLPDALRPKSHAPVAGIAYVSCTRLWTALPDGSRKRLVVELPGVSSPTFSPDARTIAFLTDTAEGQELWMAAADGSTIRRVGVIMSRYQSAPRVTGLTWGPRGDRLAFGLASPTGDPWTDSAVWNLDLRSGEFDRVDAGYAAPFWYRNELAFSRITNWGHVQSVDLGFHNKWANRRVAADGDEFAAAVGDGWKLAVIRRGTDGVTRLILRDRAWSSRQEEELSPPSGFVLRPAARLAIVGEPSLILMDLISPSGDSVIGAVDPESKQWSVLEHAWEPAVSPAPIVMGPIEAQRAVIAAESFLSGEPGRTGRAQLLLNRPFDRSLLPFRGASVLAGAPERAEDGWLVPVTVYGRSREGFSYRHVMVHVHSVAGRLVADPATISGSGLVRIETIADGVDFLEQILPIPVMTPAPLPEGTRLAARWPLYAWSYRDQIHGELNMLVPRDGKRPAQLNVGYGDNTYFNLGCGGVEDPEPIEINGVPALLGRLGPARQVIWPATLDDQEGEYSVYGYRVDEDVILAIAEAMERARQG